MSQSPSASGAASTPETPNAAQAAHWNGEGGAHWAESPDRYDTMLAPFGDLLLAAAAVGGGEGVLDVGCGCGTTTLAAAAAAGPSGHALGVDLSTAMLARARERAGAAGLTNVDFLQADAQTHPFTPATVDVVISRFGVMFFDDPGAAFANLASAVRPGGRLAFVCWQELARNEWMLVPVRAALEHVPAPEAGPLDAPGPFAFADPDRVAGLLDGAGFTEVDIESVHGPLLVAGGGTVDAAVAFFARGTVGRRLLAGIDPATWARALDAVHDALAAHAGPGGISLPSAVWRVTARRP